MNLSKTKTNVIKKCTWKNSLENMSILINLNCSNNKLWNLKEHLIIVNQSREIRHPKRKTKLICMILQILTMKKSTLTKILKKITNLYLQNNSKNSIIRLTVKDPIKVLDYLSKTLSLASLE